MRLGRRIIPFLGLLVVLVGVLWLLHGRATTPITSYADCAQAGYPVTSANPPTCLLGHSLFIGPRATPVSSHAPVSNVSFDILVDGDSHGTYPHQQQVITTPVDWARYWSTVHAQLSAMPPLLPVDFASNNVVALSLGQKPSGGYAIKITGITTAPTGTTVDITETTPGTSCIVTQSITNRYLIVRTAVLPAPVSFRTTAEIRQCR